MKTLRFLLVAIAAVLILPAMAKTPQSKQILTEKATKQAKTEAKQAKKDGWKVPVGGLPLEKQIDNAMLKQCELLPDGQEAYIMGDATSIGGTLDAARFSAMELAKVNIIQQLEHQIEGGITAGVANEQISAANAQSLTETMGNFASFYSHRLGKVKPIISLYRRESNGNYEARVMLAYSRTEMVEIAKESLRKQLEGKIEDVNKVIDCVFHGFCAID